MCKENTVCGFFFAPTLNTFYRSMAQVQNAEPLSCPKPYREGVRITGNLKSAIHAATAMSFWHACVVKHSRQGVILYLCWKTDEARSY